VGKRERRKKEEREGGSDDIYYPLPQLGYGMISRRSGKRRGRGKEVERRE